MKKKFIPFFFFLFVSSYALSCEIIFSPCIGGGRLGDQLSKYMLTCWHSIEYGYEVKLPRNYFPEFVNKHCGALFFKRNKNDRFLLLNKFKAGKLNFDKNCSCSSRIIVGVHHLALGSAIDWKNKKFNRKIDDFFSNIEKHVKITSIPQDAVSIAVHYREGGNFDSQATKDKFKNKFLDIEFFLKGIREVLSVVPHDVPVYIGLFSDSIYQNFVQHFKHEIFRKKRKNIRVCNLSKLNDVYHDLFTMSKFDFIVRPSSNFSFISHKIGNFTGAYYAKNPKEKSFTFDEKKLKSKLDRIRKTK